MCTYISPSYAHALRGGDIGNGMYICMYVQDVLWSPINVRSVLCSNRLMKTYANCVLRMVSGQVHSGIRTG